MADLERRIRRLERLSLARKEKQGCKFCGSPPRRVWRDFIIFECGSRRNDLRPSTMTCWAGFVWKLKERIEVLEAAAAKKKPRSVREMAIEEGWHPEVKREPRTPT